MPRVLAIDVGARRIGLAISDPTATLARPLATIEVSGGPGSVDAIDRVAREIARLEADDEGLETIVVGLPRRLDGTATDETRKVERFIERLRTRTAIPIAQEDERLTSVEAEN